MPGPESLQILHVDTGRELRGGQGQVLTLCKGLLERGVSQLLVCPPGSPLALRASEAGVPVRALRMRGEFDLWAAWRLRTAIRAWGANLVHVHDAHAHALAWLAARRLPDVALVVSRRVDFEISRNWISRRKYLDPRVRYLAISTGVRDVLERGGVAPEAIRIVPSGVDLARFTFRTPPARLREEFGFPASAPLIGTIGSLVDHKGHRYLLEAAPAVLERFPEARFLIVGEGELRPAFERQVRELGLMDRVLLPGYREDLEMFLSGFDLFVLPSHLEGLCTSLIDAMLFRLPAVGTRTGGVPDLIRHEETGLLVPPKEPRALAEALLRLLDDPGLAKRLAAAAHAHAMGHFTAERLVQNTLAAYQDLAPG